MPTVTASIMLSEKKKKESFSCPRPYWLCTSKSWCWCIYFVSSFAISYSAACFLENKTETFRCCCYKLTICKSFRNWLARARIDSSIVQNPIPGQYAIVGRHFLLPCQSDFPQFKVCAFSAVNAFLRSCFSRRQRKWESGKTSLL